MDEHPDPRNLVFVVCHPDDEALWIGGLIHALSGFPFLRVFVVCLSGADPASPREAEFRAAQEVAGYADGVVLGGKLRPALEPLPSVAATTEDGLRRLGLSHDDVAVVITHSPYGDEHINPHHRQAYIELLRWSSEQAVPFGYFSCVAIPYFLHAPMLRNVKRAGSLHLLAFARCTPTADLSAGRVSPDWLDYLAPPDFYLQFLTDSSGKQRMLNCYRSIDLPKHAAGYAAFTSPCESLYLFGDRALAPFNELIEQMDVPGASDLFPSSDRAAPRRLLPSAVRHVVPARIRRAIRGV